MGDARTHSDSSQAYLMNARITRVSKSSSQGGNQKPTVGLLGVCRSRNTEPIVWCGRLKLKRNAMGHVYIGRWEYGTMRHVSEQDSHTEIWRSELQTALEYHSTVLNVCARRWWWRWRHSRIGAMPRNYANIIRTLVASPMAISWIMMDEVMCLMQEIIWLLD